MVDAICRELALRARNWSGQVRSIYFGGGTPSLLNEEDFHQIWNSLKSHYNIDSVAEVTLEANPEDVNSSFLSWLSNEPITRISLGVQSFHEDDLKYMNRNHDARQAVDAIQLLVNSQFALSVDLIYGTPTMTIEQWMSNLETLVQHEVPHISAYQLTVEPRTPLANFIDQDRLTAPDDDDTVAQYHEMNAYLGARGYRHYEMSNYALPGHESIHNSGYWLGQAYLGIGPSAHSYKEGQRGINTRVNRRYMDMLAQNLCPITVETIEEVDAFHEWLMVRLRTSEGLSWAELHDRFPVFAQHVRSGMNDLKSRYPGIIDTDQHLRLSDEGMLWSDAIIRDLMIAH